METATNGKTRSNIKSEEKGNQHGVAVSILSGKWRAYTGYSSRLYHCCHYRQQTILVHLVSMEDTGLLKTHD